MITVFSQVELGVKAGLNYSANDDLNISGGLLPVNERFSSEARIGFSLGFYANADLGPLYIQPELLFTQTNSSYDQNPDLTLSYVEVPVLIGYNIIDTFSFYAGPSAQFIINDEFSSAFDLDFEKKAALAINLGAAVKFGKLGLDLRYLKGISDNLAIYDDQALDGPLFGLKTKPSQLTLSFSYQLN